jgi:hypothetical protein
MAHLTVEAGVLVVTEHIVLLLLDQVRLRTHRYCLQLDKALISAGHIGLAVEVDLQAVPLGAMAGAVQGAAAATVLKVQQIPEVVVADVDTVAVINLQPMVAVDW